jgi:hypothetical protein
MLLTWGIIFATCGLSATASTILNSGDQGGNRGWGLSFSQLDQYVSIPGYLLSKGFWPTQNLTGMEIVKYVDREFYFNVAFILLLVVSAWLRYTGIDQHGRSTSCALSMLTDGDIDHVQVLSM